jgi:hypothetical protein
MSLQDRLSNIKKIVSRLHYASAVTDAADEVMQLVRAGITNFPLAVVKMSEKWGLPKEDIRAELSRRKKLTKTEVDYDPYLEDVENPDEERSHVLNLVDYDQ